MISELVAKKKSKTATNARNRSRKSTNKNQNCTIQVVYKATKWQWILFLLFYCLLQQQKVEGANKRIQNAGEVNGYEKKRTALNWSYAWYGVYMWIDKSLSIQFFCSCFVLPIQKYAANMARILPCEAPYADFSTPKILANMRRKHFCDANLPNMSTVSDFRWGNIIFMLLANSHHKRLRFIFCFESIFNFVLVFERERASRSIGNL